MTFADVLTADFEKEKAITRACLNDVVRFLSQDTSSTRTQLVQVLRQQVNLIESQIRIDTFLVTVLGEGRSG